MNAPEIPDFALSVVLGITQPVTSRFGEKSPVKRAIHGEAKPFGRKLDDQ